MKFELRRRIHFSNCDAAGIVFYPQYFVMFNELIEDWFTDGLGLNYGELVGPRRLGLPTVKLECEFAAPSRINDEVVFGLALERLGARSMTLALDCRAANAGHELRASARKVIVFMSLDSYRSIDMPADVRQALERFMLAPPSA